MVRLHRWQHARSSTDELGVEERLRKGPGFVWVTRGGGTTCVEGLVGGGPLQSPQVLQGPLMQGSQTFIRTGDLNLYPEISSWGPPTLKDSLPISPQHPPPSQQRSP